MLHYERRWRETVRSHHAPEWRATLTPVTGAAVSLHPTAGSISKSASQWPRTTATLKIPDLTALAVSKPMMPFGSKVKIDWRVAAAAPWLTIANLHVMKTVYAVGEIGDRSFTLDCADPSALIDHDLLTGHVADGGKKENGRKVIQTLVERTLGPTAIAELRFEDEPPRYDDSNIATGSPWSIIEDLTQVAGHEAFFSVAGRFHLRPVERNDRPVDTLNVGVRGVMTAYSSTWERAVNRVVVVTKDKDWKAPDGQTDREAPRVIGVWEQTTGPNAVAKVGRNTLILEKERVSLPSKAAADRAAARTARRTEGRSRVTTGKSIGMPWVEPGDSLTIVYVGGATETAFVESLDLDLATSGMNFTVRNPNYL